MQRKKTPLIWRIIYHPMFVMSLVLHGVFLLIPAVSEPEPEVDLEEEQGIDIVGLPPVLESAPEPEPEPEVAPPPPPEPPPQAVAPPPPANPPIPVEEPEPEPEPEEIEEPQEETSEEDISDEESEEAETPENGEEEESEVEMQAAAEGVEPGRLNECIRDLLEDTLIDDLGTTIDDQVITNPRWNMNEAQLPLFFTPEAIASTLNVSETERQVILSGSDFLPGLTGFGAWIPGTANTIYQELETCFPEYTFPDWTQPTGQYAEAGLYELQDQESNEIQYLSFLSNRRGGKRRGGVTIFWWNRDPRS